MKWFVSLSLLFTFSAHAYVLQPFTTDYCTMYTEGPSSDPMAWADCCLEHDLYYWAGGITEDRDRADWRLKECVEEKGYPGQAKLIYSGVKLGHLSPIKSEKPWNNGWFGKKKYLPLTKAERQEVENTVIEYDLPPEVVKLFLEQF